MLSYFGAVEGVGTLFELGAVAIVEIDIPEHDKVTYVKVTPDMARRIIEEHIVGGKVIDEYTIDHYEAQHK